MSRRRLSATALVSALVIAAGAGGASAQPSSVVALRETVTVTAVRLQEERTFEIPWSMTVIERDDLQRRLPRTTPEALGDAVGVFVQKTNHGGGSPYLRGLIGNQVLVLVDGVRLNNATFRYGPNQYLATIDPAVIERIEVLRGSGSVLYGSDAIGGVINIVTRGPSGVGRPTALRGSLSSKAMTSGMEQSGRVDLDISGPRAGVRGGVSLRNFGDLRAGGGLGVAAPSGYAEIAGDLRGELALPSKQTLTFAYQHHRQDDVPRYDQVAQRGFARYVFDPQVRQLAYLQYERSSSNRWWSAVRATTSVHASEEGREYQRRNLSVLTAERDKVRVGGASLEVQSHPLRSLLMISGFDYYHDRVESGRSDIDQSSGTVRTVRGLYPNGATSDAAAIFTHATLTQARWRTDAGFRVSHFSVKSPDPLGGSAEIAPTTATGSLGTSFEVSRGVRLFGSLAQAFRAPNIDDLSTLGPFDFGIEVPSPGLDPESSVTVEAGVRFRTSRARGVLAAYRTSLRDLIDRVPGMYGGSSFIGDQRIYQKANVGSASVTGVEANGDLELRTWLATSASVTYTYGQLTSKEEPMRRIPPLNGHLALRLLPTRALWVETMLRFATKQHRLAAGDISDHRIPAGGTPGWNVFNVNASYRLHDRLQLVGAVQNVFDEAYRTHGSGIDGYGRSAWIGVNAVVK